MVVRKSETIRSHTPDLPGGLIPIEEWSLPGASVSRTLIGTARYWLEQLRSEITRQDETFESLDGLPELSAQQLQKIAPDPDYTAHGQAIVDAIQQLRGEGLCRRPVLILVAPPFTGTAQALRCFPVCKIPPLKQDTFEQTVCRTYRLILPPDNLLMDEEAARLWWQDQPLDQPWVISELAAFWRRHHDSLALVQELLRLLAVDRAGAGVIGCSSWCWQFWTSYYPDAQLTSWVPAPMTDERLGLWLQQLMQCNNDKAAVVRTTTDGLYVLPLELPDDCASDKKKKKKHKHKHKHKHANLLRNLAADSRGISGVALAIWRQALRARSAAQADSVDGESKKQIKENEAHTWVVPLSQLRLPVMPVSPERNLGLILHALLMHDGLATADLRLVTGLPEPDLSLALSRLLRAEIISANEQHMDKVEQQLNTRLAIPVSANGSKSEVWHVTPLGYPTTRRHLQSWGFPVDFF